MVARKHSYKLLYKLTFLLVYQQLVMSYLRHSLCSHLISHAAVLRRIVKYKRFENTFTVIALLEFLEAMLGGITCRNKPEESIVGNAVLSLVFWLTEAYKKCLDQNRINKEMTAGMKHSFYLFYRSVFGDVKRPQT